MAKAELTQADKVGRWLGWGRRGTAGAAIPATLAFEHVTQRFGAVTALDDVTLTVQPGEIVCLLGQSGCGKTTLLRLAAGVEQPTAGCIRLEGQEVSNPAAFVPPEERGVGLVFQDYALFPHMSVRDNVRFGLKSYSAADADVSAMRALSRVGLAELADVYPHTLSGGEQQRVALARAIAPRPGVLLMDEPFSNLDRRLRDVVRAETLALLRETGATTIVVTHDPEDAMRIADRVVLMRAGRIVQTGTAKELYRNPVSLFAARFFCDFSEIEGVVENAAVETPIGSFAAPGLAGGTRVTVCVRPQAVRLVAEGTGLPGRVVARRFLGDVDEIQVALPGLERPLTARTSDADGLKAGQDISVAIRATEVLVFPASEP